MKCIFSRHDYTSGSGQSPETRLMTTSSDVCRWNYLWLTLCALGFGIFLMGMPKYLDDWDVSAYFRDWFESQGLVSPQNGGSLLKYGMPWADLGYCIDFHFTYDNSRLSNILGMFMILLPKWAGSIPGWACWVYSMYATLRIADINMRRSALIPLAIFMWVFAIPWFDNMGCIMYQVNYPVTTALVLGLILLLRRESFRTYHYFLIFLLSFVTGAWHEMVSTQLIPAFAAMLLILRPKDRKAWLAAIAGLTLGFVWLISFPGFYRRAHHEFGRELGNIRNIVKNVLVSHWGIIVYWCCAAFCLWRKGWRKYLFDDVNIFTLVITVISMGLVIFTNVHERSGWLGDVFAIIGILYLLNGMFPALSEGYRLRSPVVGSVLLAAALGTLFVSDFYVLKYGREYRRACEMIGNGESDAVFVDFDPTDVTPFPVLRFIPPQCGWDFYCFVKEYYIRHGDAGVLKIVPEALHDFSFETARKIPGDNDVRMVGGKYLVLPYDDPGCDAVFYDTDFGPVHKEEVPFEMVPFNNRRDGKRYAVLIMTDRQMFRQLFGIDRMDISGGYTPRIYRGQKTKQTK